MQRLTLREIMDQHGGVLPPGAVLRPDDDEVAATGDEAHATTDCCETVKVKRRLRSGRFEILNVFVDFGISRLTRAEIAVWLVLFRDTKHTGVACTGQADIARRSGLSRRGVQIALAKLITKGFVTVVRRGRLSAGPSIYHVHSGTA